MKAKLWEFREKFLKKKSERMGEEGVRVIMAFPEGIKLSDYEGLLPTLFP